MTDLESFRQVLSSDRHLGVLITTRPGVTDPQVAVVNTAIVEHPITGRQAVAGVARRGAKLANLRRHPRATIVAKAGWEWAAGRGPVALSGPDDPIGGGGGLDPGEQLDRAFRRAFWVDSRPIQLHDEILSITADISSIDDQRLERDLRLGVGRRAIFDDLDIIRTGAVTMSPHVFLADGSNHTNPYTDVQWHGD